MRGNALSILIMVFSNKLYATELILCLIPATLASLLIQRLEFRRRRLSLRQIGQLPILAVLDLVPPTIAAALAAGLLTRLLVVWRPPLNSSPMLSLYSTLLAL